MTTIIVLLILAGVTVATLTGENGLLAKAQLAKERTAEGEQDEKNKLSSYENEINNYSTMPRTGGTVTISSAEYARLLKASNAVNYSTEQEQEVGTWIDGVTPVYQKTFTGTGTSTTSSYYSIGKASELLPNVNRVVNTIAYASFSGYLDYETRHYISIASGDDTISIGQSIESASHSFDYIITIQYTKTENSGTN